MNKQQLIDNATAKNFRIEFSQDRFGNEIIGINKNNNSYHWFEVLNSGNVMFQNSYSMNTGRTQKGFLHGLRVSKSLGLY